MIKRTAFIGAILSLIPLGQSLIIKTGLVLSTTGLMLVSSEKIHAGDNSYYFDRAYDKAKRGDYYGAIADYTKAIEINPQYAKAYVNRGRSYYFLNNKWDACEDFKKAVSIGHTSTEEWLNTEGASWCRDM